MTTVVTRDGVELFVKDWGKGRAVVLIHGWPLSADSWDDQAMALADAGYRAISYDRRGFGRSGQPWSGYDYDTLAQDLRAIVEYAGAEDVALVGFSMGGGEVVRYLSRFGGIGNAGQPVGSAGPRDGGGSGVTRVALISSVVPFRLKTPDNPEGTPQEKFDATALALRTDRAKFLTGFFEDFFGVSLLSHAVSDEQLRWAWNVAMQASLRATLACAASFSTTDFRPDVDAVRVPTLIVHGTADKTVPIEGSGRAAARRIKGATLIEYADAPHGLFFTHKRQLASDLIDFLRR